MVCRLCLSTSDISQPLELSENNSIIRTLISDVLPQVIVDPTANFIVCRKCIEKLHSLKTFKEQCFSVEKKIRVFKNRCRNSRNSKTNISLNIADIFFHYEMSRVRSDIIICRTCFKSVPSVDSHSLLGDTTQAIYLSSLFHEMDLNITSDPVICRRCSDMAEDFYQFQQKCLLVQSTLDDLSLDDHTFLLDKNVLSIAEEKTLAQSSQHFTENTIEDETEEANYFLPDDQYDIDEYLSIIATAVEDRDFNLNSTTSINLIENTCQANEESNGTEDNFESSQIDENLFRCSSCKYKTKIKHYLTRHIKIIHQKDCRISYKCLYCEFNTKNKSTLDVHVKLEHDKIWDLFECGKCDFKAKWQSLLTLHNIIKHDYDSESYQCPFCKFKTNSKDDFKKHHKYKHNDGIKTYDCLYCEYRTRYRCHLKTHIKARHDSDDGNFHKCVYCGYRTKWKSSLLMHVKFKHNNDNELHECLRCDFKTRKLSRLKIHRKLSHESTDSVSYIEFRNALRNRHRMKENKGTQNVKSIKECTIERNDDLHKCAFCNYSSKRRDTLQRHISAKHDNQRDFYKCLECDYQTKRKDALKRHADVKHPKYAD